MLIAIAVVSLFGCGVQPAAESTSTDVTATVRKIGGDYYLTFSVINGSRDPLVVVDRFLPWGGNAANWGDKPALLIDARDRAGLIPKLYPVRTLGPDATTSIASGQSASGSLNLRHYFDDIGRRASDGPVWIDWRYCLRPVGQVERVYGGTIRLPSYGS